MSTTPLRSEIDVRAALEQAVLSAPIFDIHTHLYSPCFGGLLLYGLDELLTYHYLIAEVHRADLSLKPTAFFAMSKRAQADLIWQRLFVENTPISEATRGVVTVLKALGIDPDRDCLDRARKAVASHTPESYIDLILGGANVSGVVMTNDPFDDAERPVWEAGAKLDPRFHAALRIDYLLLRWAEAVPKLKAWGYDVTPALDASTLAEVRRFLVDWIKVMNPVYLAASLPVEFTFPSPDPAARLLDQAVLPVALEYDLPFAFMPGVKRAINPALSLAGDGVGKCDLSWLEYLCRTYPDNKLMVTVLARENQHELNVIARKFANLMPFGCWWFLNNPSLIEEMTRMRFELLGLSHIPQHSDCRILDQLLYKWSHFKRILIQVMGDKYADLLVAGWAPTQADIERDVHALLAGNFWRFLGKPEPK